MPYKVFVTRALPEAALEMLRRAPEVSELRVSPHDRVLTRAELFEGTRWCDALLSQLTDSVDAELLDQNPRLRIVANYAVGFNNMDVKAATTRKIPLTNTPGVLTETTADLAFTLICSVARRIVESDRYLREGRYQSWAPLLLVGGDIHGKTLGIVGMGRIGFAVAKRALGFDMRILYTDAVRVDDRLEAAVNARYTDLETILRESDFVSVHVPLLPETRHLIGKRELALMKKTAYLVNTSRGPVVDEAALVEALQNGTIAGAGLDVYEREPELAPGLVDRPNSVLLPHIASASIETRTKMGTTAAANILARLRGERPPNLLNPEALT